MPVKYKEAWHSLPIIKTKPDIYVQNYYGTKLLKITGMGWTKIKIWIQVYSNVT